MIRRRRPRGSSPDGRPGLESMQAPVLADQVEAFVNGTLIALCAAEGNAIAPWMMLNRLAHADSAELHRLASGTDCPTGPNDVRARRRHAWALAERWLAEKVVGLSRDADEVRRIQQDVLVPLELRLASRSTIERCTLGNVLADAMDALDDYRRDA